MLSVLTRNDNEDKEDSDEAFLANFTLKITKDDGKEAKCTLRISMNCWSVIVPLH